MKKIIYILGIFLLVFGIYERLQKKESFTFSIGNKEGDIYYDQEDLRITEISMNIEQNTKVQGKEFQQILVKTPLIILDVNSLFHLTNYHSVLTQLDDLEELLKLLRSYCKEKIKLVLLTENSDIARYTNQKISILCKKYDIII